MLLAVHPAAAFGLDFGVSVQISEFIIGLYFNEHIL